MRLIFTVLAIYFAFLKSVRNDTDIASLLSDLIKDDYKSSNDAPSTFHENTNFNMNSLLMSQNNQENPFLGLIFL